ncbi:MAG: hypothetical protein H7235_10080 [Bdellovibrionaceae bacterium]|nr:hypothetical protein [Pseudobdellovibrionaceae bacterium]
MKKFNVDAEEILKSAENQILLETLARFAQLLNQYNYNIEAFSECSLKKLKEVPNEKKEQISTYFKNWSNWIDPEENPGPPDDIEKRCLQKALDHYNLKASEEFWKTLEKDQIIEFYGEDMLQLYRSLSFFKVTGYSLLDISVFEWYVLWQRSAKAVEETMNDAHHVIKYSLPVKKFEIPKQLIHEVYDVGGQKEAFVPRTVLAEFMHLGFLSKKNAFDPNASHGVICSSRAKVLSHGEQITNVRFL